MDLKQRFEKINRSLKTTYHRVNKSSGGILEVVRRAFSHFTEQRGAETAASMAYYAFFSIFPMLLVFIAIGSFFVDQYVVEDQLLRALQGIVPGVEEVIIANIERVLNGRGAVTFFALISLTWSATNVFDILVKNVNRAFPQADIPDFLKRRMLGFFMFLALGGLMLLSLAASTLSGLIPVFDIPLNGRALHETFIWRIGAFLLPVGINLLLFWAMYQWVPTIKVSRKASLTGATIAAMAWELLNFLFTRYLSNALSQYQLVYGSLSTIMVLLFWIYLTGMIALIGAHLTASIQKAIQDRLYERMG
ncbi:MAG: YihY/virulence factor BrkB family protein [Chloroflexota bacterium]|nr:YihY/virulence factor BrkB family protein [Chloroflexota bacterium]